jgi:hypothetical protein
VESIMNPAIHAGTLAGAAAKRAQENLLQRLRSANATHPSRPVPLGNLKGIESRMLVRFVEAGVVRKAGEQGYYLDERKLADYEETQREAGKRALLVVLVLAIVGLSALGLTLLVP